MSLNQEFSRLPFLVKLASFVFGLLWAFGVPFCLAMPLAKLLTTPGTSADNRMGGEIFAALLCFLLGAFAGAVLPFIVFRFIISRRGDS